MTPAPLLTDEQAATIARQLAEQLSPQPLTDAAGIAALLDVPKSWVLTEARAGRLPCRRFGKYVRFDRREVREWADARAHGPRRAA